MPRVSIHKNREIEEGEWAREMCDKCVTGSLHSLSGLERYIYLLYDVAGLKTELISGLVPLSDASIRKRMSRSREKLRSFLNDQCVLYNPGGKCKCRMAKSVKKANPDGEFMKIKSDMKEIGFLRQCDMALANKADFLSKLRHRYLSPSTNDVNE